MTDTNEGMMFDDETIKKMMTPSWREKYRYPDGARMVEAMWLGLLEDGYVEMKLIGNDPLPADCFAQACLVCSCGSMGGMLFSRDGEWMCEACLKTQSAASNQ